MYVCPRCPVCKQELQGHVSCVPDVLVIDGRVYLRIRWGQKGSSIRPRGRSDCFGCLTPIGGLHHRGCDVEECPVCGGQAARCGCRESSEVGVRSRGFRRASSRRRQTPRWVYCRVPRPAVATGWSAGPRVRGSGRRDPWGP